MPRILIIVLLALLAGFVAVPAEAQEAEEATDEEAKGPRLPLPWEVPREGEGACRPEEIVLLRQLRQRASTMDARDVALGQREAAAQRAEAQIAASWPGSKRSAPRCWRW